MSALCCAAVGVTSNGSAASVYYPFTRSSSSYASPYHFDLNPYAAAAAAAAAAMETASRQSVHHQPVYHDQQQQHQQQQQYNDQLMMTNARARRKRLENAVTEAIPSASSGKVSQRIAQLQHTLYSSANVHQETEQERRSAPRPLSLDPAKDYSQPLSVDCSIEYDLPRVARPPPGAQPLLLIAPPQRRSPPARPLRRSVRAPASASGSDSGRGTDSDREPSPLDRCAPSNTTSWPSQTPWVRVECVGPVLAVHQPRPAEAVRSHQAAETASCPCCPSRPVQRWAPYSTARHACPAPSALLQQQQHQHQHQHPNYYSEQQYGWTRWNSHGVTQQTTGYVNAGSFNGNVPAFRV